MTQRLHRKDVPLEQTWDLDGLYPSIAGWEAAVDRLELLVAMYEEARCRVGADAVGLLGALRLMDEIRQTLAGITYYADNRLAEDHTDQARQGLKHRSGWATALVNTALASFKPDLLSLPEGTLERFLDESPELAGYRLYLEEVRMAQAHQLGAEAEAVMGALTELGKAPFTIWQNTVNADVAMDPVRDDQGNLVPMSYSALNRLYQSPHRSVRKAAFDSLNAGYARHRHTIAATLVAAIQRDVLFARLRRYPSSLAAALAPIRVPESMIRDLVDAAEAGSVHLRRYMAFRSRELGLQQQAPYDMGVPLDKGLTLSVTFDEGFELVMEATATLGSEYRALLHRARRERWVDWADNVGKTPVPYSRDCHGYHPAVTVPWHGTLSDVITLAHELGHALHTAFSQASQPFVYSSYSGLLAETASTTNELLLAHHLIQSTSDGALRRYILTKAVDCFIVNFFYSSMATGLQLELHAKAERGEPLTYESVTAANTAIYHRFYGDTLEITPEGIGSQWLRVPQHYFGFSSYHYVTGITAAAALTAAIRTEGESASGRYLRFLKAGSSAPPLEILRAAGIDLHSHTPGELAVAAFSNLVTELENTGCPSPW